MSHGPRFQNLQGAHQLQSRNPLLSPAMSRLSSCHTAALMHRRNRSASGAFNARQSVVVTAKMDMQVMVKLSVAASSGKLDLSGCNLTEVPPEVCNLRGLEVRSLCIAGVSKYMRHVPLIVVQFPFHILESCLSLFLHQTIHPTSITCLLY